MTEQQLDDKLAQIIRVGFVNARDEETHRVKVSLRDTTDQELVTDWLPVLVSRAFGDMVYDLPDIDDQVLCLFLPYGLEQGFVIGSMYSGQHKPPVTNGEIFHRKFRDGSWLQYDRYEHKLSGHIDGDMDISCARVKNWSPGYSG